MRIIPGVVMALFLLAGCQQKKEIHALVFLTDFGLKDGAVAAMKGVAFSVSPDLKQFDLTHDITPFSIYEAAHRLQQAAPYWPAGTVFVSVVDPGVGSERKSIVLKTKTGHYFVTPDNGTVTLVARQLGVAEVREINEAVNRLQNSEQSYTFHGRDVYAYTGARLAANVISFEEVGSVLAQEIEILELPIATVTSNGIAGQVTVLDVQYGNVWTNIDAATLKQAGIMPGDSVTVRLYHNESVVYHKKLLLGRTFADVAPGSELAYLNSLLNFSLAVREGSFATRYGVGTGKEWRTELSKP